jgi:mono/diheme cytochrome c family protein
MKMKKILIVLICLVFSSSAFADSKMELGLEVFNNKAQCGMCHTLQAAGSEGQIGTNLDQLKPLMPQVVVAVTNGIGVMPAFEGILSSEEIDAVAYYVFESTNK